MSIRSTTAHVALALAASICSPASAQDAAQQPSISRPTATTDGATQRRVLNAAIAKMEESYVFPDKVPRIAKALRVGLMGKYRSISNTQAFTDAVNGDIERVANDRHLRLMWSSDPLPPRPPDSDKIDPAMRKQFNEFMAQHNYAIRQAQALDGNIGYLKINGFLAPEDAGPTMAAAMAFLKNSDALIIDVRDNGGGDPQGVAMLVSYLEPPETLINTFHQRNKAVNDQIWTLPYVPGGRWSTDKPVYVLTSKNTASGAEEFAYDMQQLKRGTVVGTSTWGGANPGEVIPLDDHFAVFVPTGSAVNPISKTNWEGTGVKPDVPVAATDALNTAQRLALRKLLDGATGERRSELQSYLGKN